MKDNNVAKMIDEDNKIPIKLTKANVHPQNHPCEYCVLHNTCFCIRILDCKPDENMVYMVDEFYEN